MLHLSGISADKLEYKYGYEEKYIDFRSVSTKAQVQEVLSSTFGGKLKVSNIPNCTFKYSNGVGLTYAKTNENMSPSNVPADALFEIGDIRIPREISFTFSAPNTQDYWILFYIYILHTNSTSTILSTIQNSNLSNTSNINFVIRDGSNNNYSKVTKTSFSNQAANILEEVLKTHFTEDEDRCTLRFLSPTNATYNGANRNCLPIYIHDLSIKY